MTDEAMKRAASAVGPSPMHYMDKPTPTQLEGSRLDA